MTPVVGRHRCVVMTSEGNNEASRLIVKYQMNIDVLKNALDDQTLDRERRIAIKKKIYLLESNVRVLYRMNMCRSSAFVR
ncbi:MAG TPA: hypothetical protein ENO00_05790 [Deltaproteobacteria bacterium]|nr:hypothetical protein [Deltaproteobacteria bacterium]